MKNFLFVLAFIASTAAAQQAISVPSDAKASYTVLEKAGKGNTRTIVTRRQGSSGESFSKREYDCSRALVRYLGTGDTLTEMKASRPREQLGPIVSGSIAYWVGVEACS